MERRANQFILERWATELEAEQGKKARVREQTMACREKVRVPGGGDVSYGFMSDYPERTVLLLRDTGVPVHVIFPSRHAWHEVVGEDVIALGARLQSDVLLRIRLLDLVAASYPSFQAGQQWLSSYLSESRWSPPPRLPPAPAPECAEWRDVHGAVELHFALAASRYPDKREYFYAWLIHFLVHSAATNTFEPLLVSGEDEEGVDELADWLLAFHDHGWSCEDEAAMEQIATLWRTPVQSVAGLRALLPPTSCQTYGAFVKLCDSIGKPRG
jgi:hypothetical protein